MEEEFLCLHVRRSVEQTVQAVRAALPSGVRTDGTIATWGGVYSQENDGACQLTMRCFQDGYGNALVVLFLKEPDGTKVVMLVTPDDHGRVAMELKAKVACALESNLPNWMN